jgi:hypothetical protein
MYIETNSRKQSYNKPIPIRSPVIQTDKQLSATVSARQSALLSHYQLCEKDYLPGTLLSTLSQAGRQPAS